LKPQAHAARFNLGLCYARQGKGVAAAREFELAIQGLPEDGEAFYELGLVYEKVGRKDDALRAHERGLALARSSELADKCSERLSVLRAGERRP
jgi:Flp pilus assembly protein TadD